MTKAKLVYTIVDPGKNLIGFVVEGPEKEFGGFSNTTITRAMTINELYRANFINSQIDARNNCIQERNGFSLNSLPMKCYVNNNYVDIDNSITLLGKYLYNNEIVGYSVRMSDGTECNMRSAALITISKWFNPVNFCVRQMESGKRYIVGKNGTRMENIPTLVIGDNNNKPVSKRAKNVGKQTNGQVATTSENEFDMIDICDVLAELDGSIIKFASDKYTAVNKVTAVAPDEFTDIKLAEYTSAKLAFNPNKVNVNANFKKVGIVNTTINGSPLSVYTYVHRTKSIFSAGKRHMDKFGIAVESSKKAQLINQLGTSLAFTEITDNAVIQPLKAVMCKNGNEDMAFFTVNASNIDLISSKRKQTALLTAEQISMLIKDQFSFKLVSKFFSAKSNYMKSLKESLGRSGIEKATNRKPYGQFALMSDEVLEEMKKIGFDIYTGAYTRVNPVVASKTEGDGSDTLEITYALSGYDASKITAAMIEKAITSGAGADKIPDTVIAMIGTVTSISDPIERYRAAIELYGMAEEKLRGINKLLWMHNAIMLMTGGGNNIHTHDKADWSVNTASRIKTGTVYMNSKVNGLAVKVVGANI